MNVRGLGTSLATILTLSALLFSTGRTAADEEAQPPKTAISIQKASGTRIVQAVLPGHALATTPVAGLGMAVLVAVDDDAPRSCYQFTAAGDGHLTLIARDLPTDLDTLHVLVENDRPELLVGAPGRIYSLGTLDATDNEPETRQPRLLLETPEVDLDLLRRRRLIDHGHVFIPRPQLGRLDVYRWPPQAGSEPFLELELPIRARRVRSGLKLSIPQFRLLERPDQVPLVAVGPEVLGKRRLLTTLLDPNAASRPSDIAAENDTGTDSVGEAWARFPSNERVAQSWYLNLDGRPMLAVAALSADKLGIFEKKKFRVFPLRTDRTRAGSPPALAIDTVTRNWYNLGVEVVDLNADGRDDLVILQPDGLGAKKLAVEAYLGQGNGGFFQTPRRSTVKAPDARWAFSQDLDSDGITDLVAVTEGRLVIFRGVGPTKRKGVIEKTPRWSFEASDLGTPPNTEIVISTGDPEGASAEDYDSDSDSDRDSDSDSDIPTLGRPQVVDLDSDGLAEVLLLGEIGGRSVLRVIGLNHP